MADVTVRGGDSSDIDAWRDITTATDVDQPCALAASFFERHHPTGKRS
jgi:hypothetical protein